MSARVLCVANRLPVTLTRVSSPANYTYKKSSGGLVSALKAVRGLAMVWIGWVGTEIEHAHQDMVLETCVNEYGCRPVFLTEEESMEYYDGYCNNVLWPLFHYITPPIDYTSRPSLEKNYKQFDFYRKVNMKFAAAVARCYRPGDIIWIHDYHLCILPSLLRNLFPDAIIGWFLHTSFPDNKVFRQLSTREEILEGLLGASLLGFHTYDYVRHFQDACHSVLGLEKVTDGVLSHTYGHVRCAAIPIGIDPSPFVEKCVEPQVAKLVQVMNRSLGFKRIILGVDRLDYMKGIPQKLCAFDRMLEMHPELANEVTLVQLAVPSRESVPEYKRLKSSVQQLVSSINGQKTSLTRSSVPVVFLNQSLNFEELCALYSLSEVCFITSIRDGMNLVAYEYVVCQENKHGVLLLSEFAGAAQYLAGGMTPINPWDVEGTAEALYEALKLPEAERRAMHELAIKAIYSQTAEIWARSFVQSLEHSTKSRLLYLEHLPRIISPKCMPHPFTFARKTLVVVDIMATLFETTSASSPLTYDHSKHVLRSLCHMARCPGVDVLAITGHTWMQINTVLKLNLEEDPLYWATRNGLWLRTAPDAKPIRTMECAEKMHDNVRELLLDMMKTYVKSTPGSYIEHSAEFVTWNYNVYFQEHGVMQARALVNDLLSGPLRYVAKTGVMDIVQGPGYVEARVGGMSRLKTYTAAVQAVTRAASNRKSIQWSDHFDCAVLLANLPRQDDDAYSIFNSNAADTPVEDAVEGWIIRQEDLERWASVGKESASILLGSHRSSADYRITTREELRSFLSSWLHVLASGRIPSDSHPSLRDSVSLVSGGSDEGAIELDTSIITT